MNSNDLKNISNIYQEQVSMQLDELSADLVLRASKEGSKRAAILSALGGDVPTAVKKAKKFRRQAERFYDYQAKKRRKSSVSEGKNTKPDYLDFDDDGDKQEPMTKALKDKNKKSVKEALIGRQSEIDANKNNKIDSQDFKILRSSKKKKIKEGFSNWREDLIEVVGKIESKDSKEPKVVEKEINNTVKINPNLDLGEAIEELGGTLLEMIEIGEVDFIVESVYGELLQEGYNEDDIEEALEYALTEATVTYGHDTPSGEKKKGNLLKAVGRLARQKLSSKVRGAKRAVSSAAVSGLRNVAKGALDAASKLEGDKNRKLEGDEKPSLVHSRAGTRSPSVHRGAGIGRRERVSSGSYSAPKPKEQKPQQRKESTPVSDPWEGSYKSQPKKPSPKPQAKTTTVSKKPLSQKQKQAVLRAQRRNPNLSPEDAARISSSVPSEAEKGKELRARMAAAAAKRGISEEEAKADKKSWDDYWSSAAKGYKEQYEILEKAESEQQQKIFGLALSVKRGQTSRDKVSDKVLKIVDGMSEKKIRDFAKTPHKGLPHKVETKEEALRQELVSRMIEKIEQQSEFYIDEAKLPRSKKKSKKEEKLAGPKRPKHLVQLDLDQAALREVGKKRLRDPETGKKKTTKVEPAKINVKGSSGETVRTVSTGDFHKEKLGKSETMDFSPLKNPEKFTQTTKANKKVINKSRGAVVEPNTARGAFRSEEVSLTEDKGKVANKSIVQHLKNLGYNKKRGITMKAGHFTGDMPGSGSPGKKLIATKKDIEKYKPKKVSHIDDDENNLKPLEKHRQETQGERGKKRGSDPKIHTQHVGSYRQRGESRSQPREHGGVRRFSGVRDPGNIPTPKTTKQIQRARKTARRGMGEAIETPQSREKPQNSSAINQVLQAKAKADAAERDLANKQRMATQKGVNLTSISP